MEVAPVKKREGNTALREAAGREWGRNNKEGRREVLKFLCWFKCLTTNSEQAQAWMFHPKPVGLDLQTRKSNDSRMVYRHNCILLDLSPRTRWLRSAGTIITQVWAHNGAAVLQCHSAEQTEQIQRENVLKTQSVFLLWNSLNVDSKHFRSSSRISALMSRAIISICLLES